MEKGNIRCVLNVEKMMDAKAIPILINEILPWRLQSVNACIILLEEYFFFAKCAFQRYPRELCRVDSKSNIHLKLTHVCV